MSAGALVRGLLGLLGLLGLVVTGGSGLGAALAQSPDRVSAGAAAPEDPDPLEDEVRRHGIFIDSIEVSLVGVEVFATRAGEPVLDLTADDFEILVDGEPVEIASFSRVGASGGEDSGEAGAADATHADGDAEGLGAGDASGELRQPVGGDGSDLEAARAQASPEPATVLVVVDQLFLSPLSRARVFDALRSELDRLLAGGARILVAVKSREEVRIEQGFTEDRRQVVSALDRVADLVPRSYASEIRTTIDLWDVAPRAVESRQTGPDQAVPSMQTSEIDAQSSFQEARSVTQRMHADVTSSLRALHRFLDSLAGLPGRKALVYVADQLPVRPAEILWRLWWQEYGVEHGARMGATPTGPPELDATAQLEELIADATAARVAFYPIGTDSGVDVTAASGRGASTESGALVRATASLSGDGLRWLSERTGGRAAVGPGAADGFFVGLGRDLGSYYSLAFPTPHQGDGRSHRLEVRVRRPGVTLRHPTQYRDKSADQRMADRLLSTLTLGIEENPLDVRVSVGKPRAAKPAGRNRDGRKRDDQNRGDQRRGDRVTVSLEVHVPMASLVLLPDTKVHRGKFSIQLVARDHRGRLSEPVLVRMPLEVAHRDLSWALTQTVDYATEMTLQAGGGTIAIGVHDDYGFTVSTIGVDIGADTDDRLGDGIDGVVP